MGKTGIQGVLCPRSLLCRNGIHIDETSSQARNFTKESVYTPISQFLTMILRDILILICNALIRFFRHPLVPLFSSLWSLFFLWYIL